MGGIFSSPKPKPPPPPPPPPPMPDPGDERLKATKRRNYATAASSRGGRESTLLSEGGRLGG